ncbi:MAG: hypothetical protein COX19_17375 [Desulfobacterales bacterium CG23_combo_of_CG06-09_8_20_14_all_51_8]|nr:MAG: hypothetical protein COX19_17375 [Desulfobacterales bacterium CG23_combo_of_CG06-09_8_20_14_all_51_8]
MSEPDSQNRSDIAILIPFENGTIARVALSLYAAPRGQHWPVDAYVVTECEGVFTGSARRAAETVFSLIGAQVSGMGPVVAGFDLQGVSSGVAPATGESGGLAFAIALAAYIFKQNPGAVAATGVVKSSGGNGPVDRVNGITAKIRAAIDHLPGQARILYPAVNQPEISESLLSLARRKNQILCPVTCVAEAIRLLFPDSETPAGAKTVRNARRWTSRPLLLAIAFLATTAIIVAAWVTFGSRILDKLDIQRTPPEAGQASQALDEIHTIQAAASEPPLTVTPENPGNTPSQPSISISETAPEAPVKTENQTLADVPKPPISSVEAIENTLPKQVLPASPSVAPEADKGFD